MSAEKFFQFLTVFGMSLAAISTLLIFKEGRDPILGVNDSALIAQNTNTYLGPNQKIPGNTGLIRVQVLVYNDPNPKGVLIDHADFDGTPIPLKPRDIYGYRGQASFQKPPGKYKLKWTVKRDEAAWPRTLDHEQDVLLDERDFWLQITIVGNDAEIS